MGRAEQPRGGADLPAGQGLRRERGRRHGPDGAALVCGARRHRRHGDAAAGGGRPGRAGLAVRTLRLLSCRRRRPAFGQDPCCKAAPGCRRGRIARAASFAADCSASPARSRVCRPCARARTAAATRCATWRRSTARPPSCTIWPSSGAPRSTRWTTTAARRCTGPPTRGLQVGQGALGWEGGEGAWMPAWTSAPVPMPRCQPGNLSCAAAPRLHADTIRLLLVLASRCNLPDKEGCTPLHWAAIRGHTEACTVLLQVGGGAGCRWGGEGGAARLPLLPCSPLSGPATDLQQPEPPAAAGAPLLHPCPPAWLPCTRFPARRAARRRCWRWRTAPAAPPRSWPSRRGTACWACTWRSTSTGRWAGGVGKVGQGGGGVAKGAIRCRAGGE